jgi:ABC-type transport system involved in multi-copper enzyme maturation permease subunit
MLVIAKSPALYRARITNSIVLLLMGIGLGLVYHYAGLRALGSIAQGITFVILTICIFIGVQLTSDSIAREKREGTIGLLFLTQLTSFQIVLGKLIAHGLMGFYWLLIAVPLLSLLLIIGGLEGGHLAYLVIGALNILFFSCAVGLFVSARSIDRKKAAAYGTWIVLFFWWGMPVLAQTANYYRLPAWVEEGLRLFSVSGIYNSPFAGPGARVVQAPWLNLLCIQILGWIFVAAASASLRRRWQDQPPAAKFSFREWWKNLSLGKPATRARLRKKLLDRNPFLWLVCRHRLRGLSVWIATIIILSFLIYTAQAAAGAIGLVIAFGFGLTILHKMMIAAASAHQLQIEQEQGTLEMLTSTPLRVEEIIRGQLLAAYRFFRGPSFLVLLMHGAVVASILFAPVLQSLVSVAPNGSHPQLLLLLAVGVNAVMYLFDLYVLAWAGMWGAVNVRDARNAAGFAMLRIVVLPALIYGWIMTMVSLVSWYLGSRFVLPVPASVGLWFAICLVNNLVWLAMIRRKLPATIRIFAVQRYSPDDRITLLGRVGRALGRLWGAGRGNRPNQPPIILSPRGKA